MLRWIRAKIGAPIADDKVPAVVDLSSRHSQRPKTIKGTGDEHVRAGQYAEAEFCYRKVTESDEEYPGSLVMLGFVLRQLDRPIEAREILEQAVRIAAHDADSHYLLAGILATTGPRSLEISHLQKAIELRPDFEPACRQLINAFLELGELDEAVELCDQSIQRFPHSAEFHFIRSNLYLQTDNKTPAIESCRRALTLRPASTAAQQSLSRLLLDTGQLTEAEMSYRREIELTPEHFGPHHMLGVVLSRMARHAEAIEEFERAVSLNPQSSATYASLGASFTDLDDTSEKSLALAQASFEKALSLEPNSPEYLCNLGFSHWRAAQLDRALANFDRAIEADPNNAKARWARVMLWAPAFHLAGVNGSLNRSGFGRELASFADWWVEDESDGAVFVGDLQPFFLAYQEQNNLPLLKQYGGVCAVAMQRWLDRQEMVGPVRPLQNRIRLGLVSADIRVHSIWIALIKGWLLSLDRTRFELVVFSLAIQTDAETATAREVSDVFVSGKKDLCGWVSAIREQNCEVLLYPAIGLDPMTLKLASLRLAPVQVNSWGHPDTSGLPTIDYYVSADCFEPVNSQDHYSEQLVVLPHLGNRVQPLNLTSVDPGFADLNIDLKRPVLVCPGTPYKYQPEHDHLLSDIARRLPTAQFIFCLRDSALSRILKTRISENFEAAGLNWVDHVRFVRWLNFSEFHCLLRNADVMLDTIGFSGYNTAVQAMECGLPLVTREGDFLRGRLASGVLRRMQLQELVVPDKTTYVNLVCRLVTDRPYQAFIRLEIERRRPVLFDDLGAMGPFQDFLESVALSKRGKVPQTGL